MNNPIKTILSWINPSIVVTVSQEKGEGTVKEKDPPQLDKLHEMAASHGYQGEKNFRKIAEFLGEQKALIPIWVKDHWSIESCPSF